MSKKLIKSGMIVSGMTLASRVMGLVRDVVIANLLGAGVAADVFFLPIAFPTFCVVCSPKEHLTRPLFP